MVRTKELCTGLDAFEALLRVSLSGCLAHTWMTLLALKLIAEMLSTEPNLLHEAGASWVTWKWSGQATLISALVLS